MKGEKHDIKVFSYLCSDGDVRLNWTPVTKNGATLKTGDIVSVRGKGRLKVSCHIQENAWSNDLSAILMPKLDMHTSSVIL